jgi:hypothetical protein
MAGNDFLAFFRTKCHDERSVVEFHVGNDPEAVLPQKRLCLPSRPFKAFPVRFGMAKEPCGARTWCARQMIFEWRKKE